ncbi:hypothetical protein Rhal01_02493 [Rubritalea halochordaticola]|uniref:Transcription elongation factor GreAB n=1 Tax=Rubritalea halochordaticola TaxID=714537 RepID=A0ABP9V2U8_9BACT
MSETKQQLVDQILKTLEKDREALYRAAAETHSSSTDAESKQEGKYDTRGLEASYLAEAQAEQLALLNEQITKLGQLQIGDMEDQPVQAGALVLFSTDEEEYAYFILPAGGGQSVQYHGIDFTVITPSSPIASELLGLEVGAFADVPKIGNGFISEIW